MPFELAIVGIQRDHRTGIEVIAKASPSIPIGTGIPCSPVGQVQVGIVGTSNPDRRPAILPGVAAPGLAAGLSRAWNRIESPDFPAAVDVPCGHEPADTILSTGRACNDLVLDNQRGSRKGIAVPCFGGVRL